MAGSAADPRGAVAVTDQELRQLLEDAKVIAVVGLSANPDRPSNQVAWYLHHQGYRLFGVNPQCKEPEVFGVPMVASLDQVPEPIDIVDVFRRPEHTPEVARAAVAAGARALWLQLGIASDEARAIATEAGLTYVEDRCLKVDHARLLGPSAQRRGAGDPQHGGRRPPPAR
jgi:predicted CoA-binding protein